MDFKKLQFRDDKRLNVDIASDRSQDIIIEEVDENLDTSRKEESPIQREQRIEQMITEQINLKAATTQIQIVDLKKAKKEEAEDKENENEPYPLPEVISHEKPFPICSFYFFCKQFMRFCMHQFFRDITVLGAHNIPESGPVIFCGNHQNQFMDGCILFFKAQRDVRFMVAAKVCIFINSCVYSFQIILKSSYLS